MNILRLVRKGAAQTAYLLVGHQFDAPKSTVKGDPIMCKAQHIHLFGGPCQQRAFNPLALILAVVCIAFPTTGVSAQVCLAFAEPHEEILAPNLSPGGEYGRSMFISGDWLFVGATHPSPGAVYVFQLVDGAYVFRQRLQPQGGSEPTSFGASIAAHGNRVVIGTRVNSNGAAYVFQNDGSAWNQEHKFLPFGSGQARYFGWSVAIHDDVIAVGSPVVADGQNLQGAVFVYQYDGIAWNSQQRLTNPSTFNGPADYFGLAVGMTGNSLLVGCPNPDAVFNDTGAVFHFAQNGPTWDFDIALFDTASSGGVNGFGSRMAVDGDQFVAGGPSAGVRVFYLHGGKWTRGPQLLQSDNSQSGTDHFGSSLDIQQNRVLVGASLRDVVRHRPSSLGSVNWMSITDAGAAFVFDLGARASKLGGSVTETRRLELYQPVTAWWRGVLSCWQYGPQPFGWGEPDQLVEAQLGTAVGISPVGLLVSSMIAYPYCWNHSGRANAGAVNIFAHDFTVEDCVGLGVPDECEYDDDCNGNYRPDTCELIEGTALDCNLNDSPDECDRDFTYQHDVGLGNFFWYIIANPDIGHSDFIWLNQFRVLPGGQVVTHIGLQANPFLPPNAPVTVLLYADPNNDGDPTDAVLLTSAETTAVSYDAGWGSHRMNIVTIESTYVGHPGTRFFIGAIVRPPYVLQSGQFPWSAAVAAPAAFGFSARSWFASAPPSLADTSNLANNALPIQRTDRRTWVVWAMAADCNMNGVSDQCDIDSGFSVDLNGNGIPDECDVPDCVLADVVPDGGDGVVGVPEIFEVVNNWGQCYPCNAICPGDTNEDCRLNVLDLLAVINGWGPCP